ncbi:MAG: glycosyltransferase family 4 protein [Bacteroidota bacterium]|nr:glycosyltransferase family 4 protein [Bacteroidota bacterium]MDP4215091.1 glycosyltransferase family 4 protein [Bacteroidota bacterium]MDP4244611.1 glycosyltransferase family 4 protein [Bacteroidota bacterium]MDP4253727.1 glycosyltransferase family 4 protein [Bacteroidota bacterium]MDP4258024.1 glycosyltransferase family 4 protein [Bacteroidota bacterium]
MKKFAIVTSHPIQYNAPWFRLLARSGQVRVKVFYTWSQSQAGSKFDQEFGKEIEWDIPLLDGYEYTFVKNTSADPGTHHFKGIINPTLNEEIAGWQPDAILVFGWSFVSHLRCMRYFHGKVPVLFRGDSTLLDERPGINRILRRSWLKWVYSHVDYALYVGTHNKVYFLKHGLKEEQLIFAPHAIDNDRFSQPDAQYREEAAVLRKQLNMAEDDLVILFAGKLGQKKNPFFLIELLKMIPDPRVKAVFVGNGTLEGELKAAASGDPRIRFLDFQNQSHMPGIYRLGDIFILPSRGPEETWGLGANEAMASGCAVMLSEKVGGAVDLVKEGKNGIVFRVGDLQKCSDWVAQLAADRQQLDAMKNGSRSWIDSFSFDRIVKAIEKFMADVPQKQHI